MGVLAVLAATPAFADCAPPDLITAIDLNPLTKDGRMTLSAGISGKEKILLLDSAGGVTTLNQDAVAALNLHTFDGGDVRLLDAKGNASRKLFQVDALRLGDLSVRDVQLMVSPDPVAKAGFDGSLAMDVMSGFDVEMNFAERQLSFYAHSSCHARLAQWKPGADAVPLIVINRADQVSRVEPVVTDVIVHSSSGGALPTNVDFDPGSQYPRGTIGGTDVRLRVSIDGKEFTALIDTAAPLSTMSADVAKAVFDVTEGSPGSGPLTLTPEQATGAVETVVVTGSRVFEHAFHNMTVGNVTVADPHFLVRPIATGARDSDNRFMTGSHIYRSDDGALPDITIGMNILKQFHLYFALQEKKLYLAPRGAQ